MEPALEALEWVLEAEPLAGRLLFLRARPMPLIKGQAVCVQTLKPHYDELAVQGYEPVTEFTGEFDGALILGTPSKEETLGNIARGFDHLKPEGQLLCSVPNDLGGASLEKMLAKAAEEIITSSKRKCRIFGCRRDQIQPAALEAWRAHAQPRESQVTGLWTQPGIFGWNKIDPGSRLLGDSLPTDLKGVGADLGGGNGYLSRRVLEKNAGFGKLHLFEAEKLALDAAQRNLPERVIFHWQDVTNGLPEKQFDWVVMNPPFHQAAKRNLELGLRFVEEAARTLKHGAPLYMVCNQNLPYEEPLASFFTEHKRLAVRDGFKVLWAKK